MTCTYCHTVSCYVCRSIIRGYDHFDEVRLFYLFPKNILTKAIIATRSSANQWFEFE